MLLAASLAMVSVLSMGCSSDPFENLKMDPTTDPPSNAPPPVPSQVPPVGSVEVALTADNGAANDAVVSFGMPFPQGVFKDETSVTLRNGTGQPVPITTRVLARWPNDESIRSVLVAFKATLPAGANEKWKIDYGMPSASPPAGELEANPDGPVVATLPAAFYAKSHVGGIILAAAENKRFPTYEAELDRGAAAFDLSTYGIDCNGSSSRTYYDGPHAQYQRFLRTANPKHLRGAHSEARWYRDNEITWYAGRKVAVQNCQEQLGEWGPDIPLDWGVLRTMLSQGMLDDYLITGDPAAKELVLAMGEAYRLNLPALSAASDPILEITERNLGWPLMGLASYYALDRRNEVRDAMRALVGRALAWQARGTSGALEHDLERPDPDECGQGAEGASPFMTSLVVDGMMEYWLLTSDGLSLQPFMQKLATWYEKSAITSDKKAFRYLWNCQTEPYDDSETADLNLLIVHVFGAAYVLTRDKHWLDFGDTMADFGIDLGFTKRPKQWNQSARAFGKYLGYRAMGAMP